MGGRAAGPTRRSATREGRGLSASRVSSRPSARACCARSRSGAELTPRGSARAHAGASSLSEVLQAWPRERRRQEASIGRGSCPVERRAAPGEPAARRERSRRAVTWIAPGRHRGRSPRRPVVRNRRSRHGGDIPPDEGSSRIEPMTRSSRLAEVSRAWYRAVDDSRSARLAPVIILPEHRRTVIRLRFYADTEARGRCPARHPHIVQVALGGGEIRCPRAATEDFRSPPWRFLRLDGTWALPRGDALRRVLEPLSRPSPEIIAAFGPIPVLEVPSGLPPASFDAVACRRTEGLRPPRPQSWATSTLATISRAALDPGHGGRPGDEALARLSDGSESANSPGTNVPYDVGVP